MSFEDKLDNLIAKHDELQSMLSSNTGFSGQEYARLSKEFTELNELVEVAIKYREVEAEIRDLNYIINEDDSDKEVKFIAEGELRELKKLLPNLKREVQILLLPKDIADTKNAILEVRAGTGGDEASLFGADLLKMYQK